MIPTQQPRPRVSWSPVERRSPRLGLWLGAFALLGMLLIEVWQNSTVTQLCLDLKRTHDALTAAQTRVAYDHAQIERRVTRASLSPLAGSLGLAPADAKQVVMLPAEYLARDESRATRSAPSLAASLSEALVPEATARERDGNTP
jgi:hypothetical protein